MAVSAHALNQSFLLYRQRHLAVLKIEVLEVHLVVAVRMEMTVKA